mmetsp:Transcript_12890/g.15611  ORF Transcript_12890/g.15611 Transcript_12890/m.15611 type:complete len:473 (+) Transcript_12890:244-1662(+)
MARMFGTSHQARYWLSTDSCGLCCAFFTVFLILYSLWVMTNQILMSNLDIATMHVIIFNTFGFLALASHMTAMFTNPGAVPRIAEPLPGDAQRLKEALAQNSTQRKRTKGWCHRCVAYKPPRAHHDSVTGRCIVKLDHFCPWTNNAIGVRNHKSFLLFIFYTFLMCSYALALLFRLAYLSMQTPDESNVPQVKKLRGRRSSDLVVVTPLPIIEANASFLLEETRPQIEIGFNCVIVGVFAILFGLFTSCMLCDQWSVVTTHVAKIDRLKGDAEDLEAYSGVNEIFGASTHRCRIEWLLPTLPRFPHSIQDEILGYQTAPASRTWIDPELGHSLPDESKEASATPTKATPSQNEMLQSPLVQATSHQGVPNTTTTNFSHVDNPDSASPRVEIVHPDTISTPSEKEAPTTNDSPPAGGLRSPIGATLTASTPSTSASNGSGDTIAFNFLSFVPLLGRFLPGNSSSEKKTTRHAE